ncbi:Farnesyl pyrophosphate synthase [Trichinella spiralis]|uniref:Farnesyl pyrophosphate synthase n=1 Tax=Trichinella spiralis TaxID=6334 RepID=A0ABR3KZZ0_TRISP
MDNKQSGNNSNYLENLDAPTFKSFATDDASSVDDSWFDRRKETPILKQGDIFDEKQHNNDSLANNHKNLSACSSNMEKAGKEEISCQLDSVSSPLIREKSYEVITTKKADDFLQGNIIEPVELVGRSPVEYLEKRYSVNRLKVRRIMRNKSSTVGDTNQKAECPVQLQSEKRKSLSGKIQPTTTPAKDQSFKILRASISEIEKAVVSKLVITKSEISKTPVSTMQSMRASSNKARRTDQPSHVGAQRYHTPLAAPKNAVQWKPVTNNNNNNKPNDQKKQMKQFPTAKTDERVKVGSLQPLRVLANSGPKLHDNGEKATSDQQNVAKLDYKNEASVKLNTPGIQKESSTKGAANEGTPEKQRGNQLKRGVPAWAHSPNVGLRLGQKKALTKPMPFQLGNRSSSAVLTEKISVQPSKTAHAVVVNKQQPAQKPTTFRVSSTHTVTKEFRFATEERCRHYLEKEKMPKKTQTAAETPRVDKYSSAKKLQPGAKSSVSITSSVVGNVKKSQIKRETTTTNKVSSKARLYDDYIKQRKDQWKQAELKSGQNQKVEKKQQQREQQPGPSKARPFKQNKDK